MAATCMAVCKGSRKKIRGIFISSCHLPVAVECDIVILSEPGPIPQAPVGQFCRHNLSPRGDGNTYPEKRLTPATDTTYPREGTETSTPEPTTTAVLDTTYPREGTETYELSVQFPPSPDTTYPREGTETVHTNTCIHATDDTTYPREGTETIPAVVRPPLLTTQLIPARGRKRLLPSLAAL